jgi:hypothetical protein
METLESLPLSTKLALPFGQFASFNWEFVCCFSSNTDLYLNINFSHDSISLKICSNFNFLSILVPPKLKPRTKLNNLSPISNPNLIQLQLRHQHYPYFQLNPNLNSDLSPKLNPDPQLDSTSAIEDTSAVI